MCGYDSFLPEWIINQADRKDEGIDNKGHDWKVDMEKSLRKHLRKHQRSQMQGCVSTAAPQFTFYYHRYISLLPLSTYFPLYILWWILFCTPSVHLHGWTSYSIYAVIWQLTPVAFTLWESPHNSKWDYMKFPMLIHFLHAHIFCARRRLRYRVRTQSHFTKTCSYFHSFHKADRFFFASWQQTQNKQLLPGFPHWFNPVALCH